MPSHELDPGRRYRVAEWRLHAERNRIENDREEVQLEPRVMSLLVHLVERPGEVVSREELLGAIWGDVVVQEEALTHAVSRLRSALGDDRRAPRFVETIPKRGYRWVAPVTLEEAPVPASPREPTGAGSAAELPFPRRIPWTLVVSLAAALTVAALAWAFRPEPRSSPDSVTTLDGVPLTGLPGREFHPAVSPDGTRTVFAWSRESLDESDLFVTQRRVAEPLELTRTPGMEHGPRWSPDGAWIAYVHDAEGEGSSVRRVAAIGGPPRSLLELPIGGSVQGLDWHRDGDWLVIALREGTDEPWTLHRLSSSGADEGTTTPLFPPLPGTRGDTQPAVSPDGERIAFLRADEYGFADLHVARLDGGDVRRLTRGLGRIRGLDWRDDGGALVFAAGSAFASEFRLWSLDVEKGERTWLPTRGKRAVHPTVASGAGDLVYSEETYRRQLERVAFAPGSSPEELAPRPFARSTSSEYGAQHSPSGERVAFLSTRTGNPEVWVCDAQGQGVRRITSFDGALVEFVKWSPDERRLAFDATPGDRSIVHVADVAGETARPLVDGLGEQTLMGWSVDGRSIYMTALEAGTWSVYRVEVESGEWERVLPFRVFMLAESEDGGSIRYVRPGPTVLWRAELDGSGAREVCELEGGRSTSYWKLTADGLIFYRDGGGHTQVAFRRAESGEIEVLHRLPSLPVGLIDVSPDRRSLLYDHLVEIEADLVLVEGVR